MKKVVAGILIFSALFGWGKIEEITVQVRKSPGLSQVALHSAGDSAQTEIQQNIHG